MWSFVYGSGQNRGFWRFFCQPIIGTRETGFDYSTPSDPQLLPDEHNRITEPQMLASITLDRGDSLWSSAAEKSPRELARRDCSAWGVVSGGQAWRPHPGGLMKIAGVVGRVFQAPTDSRLPLSFSSHPTFFAGFNWVKPAHQLRRCFPALRVS